MEGSLYRPPQPRRQRASVRRHRSSKRHFRHGRRAAVLRAVTAGELVLNRIAPSIAAAAERCGSCPPYVQAAIVLLQSEKKSLLGDVIKGRVPLLAAAREVERLAKLVTAFRQGTAADRVAFAKIVGPTVLFDTSLVPAL
jgi:hypothetical protein